MLIVLTLMASSLPGAPTADRPVTEEITWTARRKLVAAARGDPAIGDVQAAAARCADPLGPDRGAVARARSAALLPRVTAEVRVDDRSYRVVGRQVSGEVDYSRLAPGWAASVSATWDLAGLVAPQSGRLTARGLLESAQRRDQAVKGATSLYFERRRQRLALETDPPVDPAQRARAELEIDRLGAELDALTCGAFAGAVR